MEPEDASSIYKTRYAASAMYQGTTGIQVVLEEKLINSTQRSNWRPVI